MTDDLTPQGAAAVRLAATVVQLKAERDRARGIAVALEQRLARVEALAEEWDEDCASGGLGRLRDYHATEYGDVYATDLRTALEADR